MVGSVACDFILWIVFGRMERVAFIVDVAPVYLNDPASHMPCLGIPSDLLTDIDFARHMASYCNRIPVEELFRFQSVASR